MMIKTAGLFDVQVNGFAGVDFNDATLQPEQLTLALEAMLATGVTSCLPTLITADMPTLRRRFLALDKAVAASPLARVMVPGYHLEGPFLNPQDGYAGCHPPQAMAAPDAALIAQLQQTLSRPILKITYAPEFDPEGEFADAMSAAGIVLAVGHSMATAEQITRAVEHGVTMSTHLGNGIPRLLPKFDNTLVAQATNDNLFAGLIADGLHIPPAALKMLLRCKTTSRAILVTDATSAAGGLNPGHYVFADQTIELSADGVVRMPGSPYLAGSSLTLDNAIRNLLRWQLASFAQAIAMSSDNPRRLLEPALRRHNITLPDGEVVWNDDHHIESVRVGDIYRQYAMTEQTT
ncbi:N-acetylglucosamine-6-phosphate deacetylase [Rahnella woolbedingensis]|uniref:N-acetylglucosamine-6-phosphate deacetylase n=1 Tax=Rahnella woolbedingensis TaxID=1510574 RepID=A0A419N2C9_9GAMM|nr:N-acetylglucosamine-6-phosphate deacetylase [Rahnella woolbedingensis]RJT34214.1 N-acetylglucosamine-6-phosphate deacetylase [Rahnella woolbedingensis]